MMDCELAAGRLLVTQLLTHRHVRRSSTRVNVVMDKEWNSNVLKFAKVECDVSIFTNLKLSFLVVVFFNVYIVILLSLLWWIFWLSRGGRQGFKNWKTGWIEPYVNLGCTLSLLANWLFNFKVKLCCRIWFFRKISFEKSCTSVVPNPFYLWPLLRDTHPHIGMSLVVTLSLHWVWCH